MTILSDKYIARPIPLLGSIAGIHRDFVNKAAYEITPSLFVKNKMALIDLGFDVSIPVTLTRYESALGKLFRADVTLHPDFAYTYFTMKGDEINNQYSRMMLDNLSEDIKAYLTVIHNQTIGLS